MRTFNHHILAPTNKRNTHTMKKAITTQASQMAAATMEAMEESMKAKYGEVQLWAVCYRGFKAGLNQDEVNEIIDSLRNKMIVEFYAKV